MAMSFTLVTSCREALSGVISTRLIREQEEEDRKTREYEEVRRSRFSGTQLRRQAEAARTRGTPLTPETFQSWRKQFTAELKQKRDKEEDERIKALPPKEREDVRKRRERLSGGFSSLPLSINFILACPVPNLASPESNLVSATSFSLLDTVIRGS
jgi:type II secretory ATPase GspE/PulE/Tfp pilus assembly ATPase PilB-like protein